MADITRDKLKDAISSGRLESALERAAGSFDFAKATATCFSQIAQKPGKIWKVMSRISRITRYINNQRYVDTHAYKYDADK